MIERPLYLKKIRPFIGTDVVKVITGIRRCGKSLMLQRIQEELRRDGIPQSRILSWNFASPPFARVYTAHDLWQDVITKTRELTGKVFLFFDEIQKVAQWTTVIASLRVDINCDIFVTGSSPSLLPRELADRLAGRAVTFVLHPFSFSEFLDLYQREQPQTSAADCFRQYLVFGGMPYLATLHYEPELVRQYLQDLFTALELKDMIRYHNIRDAGLLERILHAVLARAGTTFPATQIAQDLKRQRRTAAPETVRNALRAGADALLFYPVRRFDIARNKLLRVRPKYYLADHAIRETVIQGTIGGSTADITPVLENIVFLELLRRGWQVSTGTAGDQDIDFIARRGSERIYVQVCPLLASPVTVQREFGACLKIRDNYPKYVLSLDEFDMSRDGIVHRNIRDFLLDRDWQTHS